jgi:hypothetical protein
MELNNVIETIGSITKMEILESVRYNVLNETLVLKNLIPFPGYSRKNDTLNFCKNQESILITLRYQYPSDKINRIFKKLVAEKIIKGFPSYGEINMSGLIYPCIRLKGLPNYSLIPYIQQFFQKNELQLMNYKDINGPAIIKIFKSFRIIKIAEGLYRDANDLEKIYIRIPLSMIWNDFDEVTKKIKLNIANPNFDAALGAIYRFYGSENVIRIYDKEITFEKARNLKMMYLKEIKTDQIILSNHLQYD